MTPERIAPLVVYLTHPSCDINGKTFEVGGGWITEVRSERAVGAIFSGEMTAEQLATRFSEVEDFSSPSHPENVQDVIQRLVNLHQLGPNSTNGENIDSKTVMGLIKTYFDSGAELPLKEKLTFYFEIKSGSNIDTYTIALEDGKG